MPGLTKYSISICSNSRVRKVKLPGVISLRNALPIWAMPKGSFLRVVVCDVLEVDEDALRRLRPQVGHGGILLHRPDEGLEHHVELPRLGQLAAAVGASVALDMVGTETLLAGLAVNQRIGEVLDVAGGPPYHGVHEDGSVDADQSSRS